MASRPGLWCLIGVIMFPGFKAYEKTKQPIPRKGLLGDNGNFYTVECSLRTSDTFAGMTLYDVKRETDVYISINSKNECKTKHLLGQCEYDESSVSLKAVISDITKGEIRTFACNSTWLEPEYSQGHVAINITHIEGCSRWIISASILITFLSVTAVSGWAALYLSCRGFSCRKCCCPLTGKHRKKNWVDDDIMEAEVRFVPSGKEDLVQKTIESELKQKGIRVPESAPQPKVLVVRQEPHPAEDVPTRHTYRK